MVFTRNNSTDTTGGQALDRLILLLFFFSGFTSLIYQVLWVRMLTMFVGGSAFSVSIVLTVFMGGLALGSILAARVADRFREARSLLLLYGILQLLMALYGALFPFLLAGSRPAYALLYRHLHHSLLGYNAASSLISMALLLIPTTLMGATLPFLCRYYVKVLPAMGTRTGRLYGINTIGAAAGALATGFWLIPAIGINLTLATAVTMDLLIGLTALALSQPGAGLRARLRLAPPSPRLRETGGNRMPTAVFLLLAVSGFCSMGYEVVWTKLLALQVGPTTYSFTVVLFTFITGLAIGSILFGRLADRSAHPFRLALWSQVAACFFTLLTSQMLGNSQVFFAKLLYHHQDSFLMQELLKSLALFGFMLPPTLCLGAIFPIATKLCTRDYRQVGRSVGELYTFNTIGALLGSFCSGFLLVPLLGQAHSLSLLIALHALVVLFAALTVPGRRRKPVAAAAVMLGVLALVVPRWNQAALAQAKYHRFEQYGSILRHTSWAQSLLQPGILERGVPNLDEILYLSDGIGGFTAVGKTVNSLGATNIFLSISGKTDASSHRDLATMTLSGQVPMMLHPAPRKAMVVGLASGITAGEMLHYPLEQLDVLEISPQVVEACAFFNPWNNGVLTDPRARILMQDARTHLTLTDEQYDVIMSEPSNPWMAGVANLFTREYFEKVRAHLAPGGIFVQWFHTYQTDWENVALFGRTLSAVFPRHVIMRTATEGEDYLFLCFEDPDATLDLDVLWANLPYAQRSGNMVFPSPKVLYPLIVSDGALPLFGTGPLHTDRHPLLEYRAPKLLYAKGVNFDDHVPAGAHDHPEILAVLQSFSAIDRQLDFARFMQSMHAFPFNLMDEPNAEKHQLAAYRDILTQYAKWNLVVNYDRILNPEDRQLCLEVHARRMTDRLQQLQAAATSSPAHEAVTWFDLGDVHRAGGDFAGAADMYLQAVRVFPGYAIALQNLAASRELLGQHQQAIEALTQLLESGHRSARLLARRASNYVKLGRREDALRDLEQALQLDANFAPALMAAGALYAQQGDFGRCITYSRQAIAHDPKQLQAYQNLAGALLQQGKQVEALEVVQQGLRIAPSHPVLTQLYRALTGSTE